MRPLYYFPKKRLHCRILMILINKWLYNPYSLFVLYCFLCMWLGFYEPINYNMFTLLTNNLKGQLVNLSSGWLNIYFFVCLQVSFVWTHINSKRETIKSAGMTVLLLITSFKIDCNVVRYIHILISKL